MPTDLGVTTGRDAFSVVFATHRDDLVRFATLLCGDRDLAHDLVADAFAATWPRYDAGHVADVGAYLRRVVVNNCNTFWRRRALRRDREERRRTADHRGVLSAEDLVTERDAVLVALDRLPQHQRTTIVLRFWDDRDTDEIAELTGVSASTVRSRLSRAAVTLRDLLGDDPTSGQQADREGLR